MGEERAGALEPLYRAGRAAWPDIDVARERFEAFAARPDAAADDERAADLYLACACAAGDGRAAAAFAAAYGADLERAAERVRVSGISPDDARQTLLHRILVGDEERPPKIAAYSGRGSLKSWVRAVAARAAIDLHRRGGGREVSPSEGLFENLTDSSDPEIEYLKRHYRAEFRQAFETAVGRLGARDRNTLRHIFVERLTIDQMAALYAIHRSTAARRMAGARAALLEATRAALAEKLEVGQESLDSIMRLIGSRFEVSVRRIFAAEPAKDDDRDDA